MPYFADTYGAYNLGGIQMGTNTREITDQKEETGAKDGLVGDKQVEHEKVGDKQVGDKETVSKT